MDIAPPRPPKGANPRLSTLHEVERIVRHASETEGLPLSMAEIARRMNAKSVRPQVVKAAIQELERHHLVAISEKGVIWIAATRDVWDQSTEELA